MSIQPVTSSMVASKCNKNNASFTSKEPQKSQQPQKSITCKDLASSTAALGCFVMAAFLLHSSKMSELSEKFEIGMKSLKDDLKYEINSAKTSLEFNNTLQDMFKPRGVVKD